MRTPGDDKALIIGLMQSEGIIEHYHQLESVLLEVDDDSGKTSNGDALDHQREVKLHAGVVPDIKSLKPFNLALIGFSKKSGFNLYHGDWR